MPEYKFELIRQSKPIPKAVEDEPILVFHALTGFASGPAELNIQRGLEFIAQGGILKSAAERGDRNNIFARDAAAGDDGAIFCSPVAPLDGYHTQHRPVLAFRAEDIFQKYAGQLRVRDLDPYYASVVAECAGDGQDLLPDDFDELDYDEREKLLNEARAQSVAEELQILADAGTIRDRDDSLEVLRILYAKVFARIPDPQFFAEFLHAYRERLPELAVLADEDDFDDVLADVGCPSVPAAIENQISTAWFSLLREIDALFWLRQPAKHPEILVRRPLPANAALLLGDGYGNWAPVPEDALRRGFGVFRQPPVLYSRGK
jgi:hypothetical protein